MGFFIFKSFVFYYLYLYVSITDLYNNHQEWIRIASYNLFSKRYAEDVVQDMYIKMHNSKQAEISKCYIYKVIKHIAIDYYNSDKFSVEKSVDMELILKLIEDSQEEEIKTKTLQIINKWPIQEKEVFKLKLQGKAIRTIAIELNTTKDIVWTIYKRCKNKLKEEYGKA